MYASEICADKCMCEYKVYIERYLIERAYVRASVYECEISKEKYITDFRHKTPPVTSKKDHRG